MSDVINRTTLQQLSSVNSPDYPSAEWIHNPDLSAVSGVAKMYWKIVGDDVLEMTQAEKDAVDAARLEGCKLSKYGEIDARTDDLIALGFEFP